MAPLLLFRASPRVATFLAARLAARSSAAWGAGGWVACVKEGRGFSNNCGLVFGRYRGCTRVFEQQVTDLTLRVPVASARQASKE
jgi:hypothetical protein